MTSPPAAGAEQDVTYLPPTDVLRQWADHPAKGSGYVPIHPVTLRALADELDRLREEKS